jgi:hypothetical protein
MLRDQYSVPTSTLDAQLTIHPGNIKDPESVAKALIAPDNPYLLVNTILFGVGGTPKTQVSIRTPITIDDPHICESGMRAVQSALENLATQGISRDSDGRKPLIIVISSTGIDPIKNRDIPLAMLPIYTYMLQVPAADKRKMEQLLREDNGKHFRDIVIVKGAMFTEAKKGLQSVKVGWEWAGKSEGREKAPGPHLGYTIGKQDVGEWVFKRAIVEGGWEGKVVTLTH